MSIAAEIEAKWDEGCEDDTLDPGALFGKLLEHAYSLEHQVNTFNKKNK